LSNRQDQAREQLFQNRLLVAEFEQWHQAVTDQQRQSERNFAATCRVRDHSGERQQRIYD
jgi:hypothetical protein